MSKRLDYELGEEAEVERATRAGAVVSVRFEPAELVQLLRLAEREQLTLAQAVRHAVQNYLRQAGADGVAPSVAPVGRRGEGGEAS